MPKKKGAPFGNQNAKGSKRRRIFAPLTTNDKVMLGAFGGVVAAKIYIEDKKSSIKSSTSKK